MKRLLRLHIIPSLVTRILTIACVAFLPVTKASAGMHVAAIPLTATYSVANVSICGNQADGSITVTPAGGTGPYTYSWTGLTGIGALIPYTAGNLSTLNNLLIGYYNVVITDAAANTITITGIHVAYAFAIYITNSGSISSSCHNTGAIILYGNSGVKPYVHSLDGVNYQVSNLFTNLAVGPYTAYMKDAAGCISTKAITVTAAPPVTVSAFVRPASSCSNDGVVELYRTGGIPSYTYSLDNITYQTSNIFSGLQGGAVVTGWVKDSQGCTGSLPGITITQGSGLVVNITKTNSSTCVVDGSLQFNASGGIPPYLYSLDNVNYQVANTFAPLPANNYHGWVKDSRGCKGVSYANISLNPIIVSASVTDAASCAATDGSIQLFHTGGTGSFTYSLDGNEYQSSNTFTGLAAGLYTGFVKDGMTCIGMLNINVGPVCP